MDQLEKCVNCASVDFSDFIKSKAQMHPSGKVFQFQSCDNCGLVFLNPRLEQEDLSEYYSDFYLPYRGAAAWGKHASRVERDQKKLDKQRVDHLMRFVRMDEHCSLLDIGCGKPDFLKQAVEKTAVKAYGIDFSDEGWRKKEDAYQGIHLSKGELEAIPDECTPDVITMWHYLEHDYHPDRTLRTIHQKSAEGATLIIEVPDHDSPGRVQYGGGWAGYHTPRHTFLFDPKSITEILERSGWQVIDINRKGTLDAYNLYWMSKAEQKGIDWSGSMEKEFIPYVKGLIAHHVKKIFRPDLTLGIMTITAKRSDKV